ncbi:fatty acyl-CoA reductase 3-like [Punica granatum]|uniref:Fatty acyl-CoA reductase n=2 Tax=Punica granatum TaxID=22663 RepID=A0A218WA92_PUNGR|nr:fatty acyl-CoA reductase 3-like [Punica granatum]OWM68992.1 hypothetical protein CDL15_Pgr025179 [Punica granatum]PKI40537.1 hypothetical protein CRG98_039097 [Punica granatum]
MEFGSVVQFLEDKTILVTGATGFLAKIFVEKVLRVQPNVKKLYLLLRASDAKTAAHRFHNEVIGKDLFRVLKEMWGENFSSLISEKVAVVAGDISVDYLGVKGSDLREQMWGQIDAIINLAATTKFDERYDVSLGINTLGSKHVVDFAKRCGKLKVLVHVSTAYVCGEKGGLIEERHYQMGQTLNGASGLDIDAEVKLAQDKLKELTAMGSTPQEISMAMKDLGISRAKTYGWPNTYVFTKAMGEMLVGRLKGNLPVVTSRPTIISSTYKEPFPGWVEGVRTIDSLTVSYGKGKLPCFLCDPRGIIDVIPADMVVNSIIVAMAANAGHQRPDDEVIYQVGSSLGNPLRYCNLEEYGYRYFSEHPWINKEGKAVIVGKVKILSSMASFRRYMALRYLLLLKGLEVANAAFCQFFQGTYLDMSRKINHVMRLMELYRPYLFFKGVFDDINTEKLRAAMRDNGAEADIFYFNPKCINWDDYFRRIHLPGVVKYVLK